MRRDEVLGVISGVRGVITNEIRWSEENKSAGNVYQEAFIGGLRQAKSLIDTIYAIESYPNSMDRLPDYVRVSGE